MKTQREGLQHLPEPKLRELYTQGPPECPSARSVPPPGQRRDCVGVSRGVRQASTSLQVGPGRLSPSCFPSTFGGLDSESPPYPFSPSYWCTRPASPVMTDPPPPNPPRTALGVQAFQQRLTHPVIHTQLHRVVHSLHAPLHTVSQSFSLGYSHRVLSRGGTRGLLQPLCRLLPPTPAAHTHGVRPVGPLPRRDAHRHTCTHTRTHTRPVIILDMPFLLRDSSSGDAQSCHLDEK